MFGIYKNRINVFFSKDGSSSSVLTQMSSMSYNDVNSILVDIGNKKASLNKNMGHKNSNTRIIGLIEDLNKKDYLFRLDWLIFLSTYSVSNEFIMSLLKEGQTILIAVDLSSEWFNDFQKFFENETYFIYETSWNCRGRMMSVAEANGLSNMFPNIKININNYYLENLQTGVKYSLDDWINIERRNLKLKKI